MATDYLSRPIHPTYGRALGGTPRVIDGATFRPYRTGILRYTWIDDSHRVEIWDRHNRRGMEVGFDTRVDGEFMPHRFRRFDTAARGGLARVAEAGK